MINTTKDRLVFLETGDQLSSNVSAALSLASSWILEAYGLKKIDLQQVSSKTHLEIAFSAFADEFILRCPAKFDEDYVRDAFEFVSVDWGHCPPDLFARLIRSDSAGLRGYRKTYLPPLRRGFSSFLVALHIRRAIILPYSFKWPMGVVKDNLGKVLRRRELCALDALPELLRFIRTLESQSETQKEDVFNGYSLKQRERLASLGQRLIVATGWLTPEDANYEDLHELFEANKKNPLSRTPNLGCLILADLLERKYQSRSPISAEGWSKFITQSRTSLPVPTELSERANDSDARILEQALAASAYQMTPKAMAPMTRLPGLDFALSQRAKVWLDIENAWLKKVKQESNKHRTNTIGYLNIYLFAYLPYWFEAHPTSSYEYPDTPRKLLGSVFVSDLGLLADKERPVTLVEFFSAVAKKRAWANATHYAYLKTLEKLFDFIERIGEQSPACMGFQQPLRGHDYPRTARSYGTNKRPIPRRVFKLHLSYIDALAAHAEVLLNRILSGEVVDSQTGILLQAKSTTIDCFSWQDLFGFIPIVFHRGRLIPLRRIPNVLHLARKRLIDGRVLRIPHPHMLNQILVALYTGIRHNHIQWLDADSFDRNVPLGKEALDYATLHVNTDKTKVHAWQSHVDFRVIEILRSQLTWRKLIAEKGFSNRVFYNNNPDTKWGSYYPLFSYDAEGRPHSDGLYHKEWNALLAGLQGILRESGEAPVKLARLLPSSVPYTAADQAKQLYEYGRKQKRVCELVLKSDVTPHSARVSVVTHAISYLPADLIGRYWTGQTEASVYHYVAPEQDEISSEQQRQNLAIRNKGYNQGFEEMLLASPGNRSPLIKADDVNSNLSKSLKENFDEALSAYGCISISFSEDSKTGLDVLRDTRAAGAVENKTEICPYGNQCPPEVVSQLKGWRRCGPCQFAVRSVDHLPAVSAKTRQILEGLSELEARISAADGSNDFTDDELDSLEQSRSILAEDLASWRMVSEVLEMMRQRIATGESVNSWHVQKPEIIERDLRQALFPTETTEYVLARLKECEAFPMLESAQIRARFDLLRRQLLANTGNIRAALKFEESANPAAECLGLLRSIVAAHHLTLDEVKKMLESDSYLDSVPSRPLKLL